jgi:penicillin-binding protein 1C
MSEPQAPSTSPLVGEVDRLSVSEGGREGDFPQAPPLKTPSLTLPHKGGGDAPPAWKRLRIAAVVAVTLVFATAAGLAAWIVSLGPVPLGEGLEFSTQVLDRDGKLLRPYATSEGRWRLPLKVENVDPRFIDLLIAYEDKRFRTHLGADPLALARGLYQLVANGRIVSGGSTLTMQVARLLEPRTERTFGAKLKQIVRAIQLERVLTKDEILSLYLNLAPYGGNLEGTRAAALAYFGKEPRRLTLGEAALLVAIPQSPETRRPDRAYEITRRARDRVLDRIGGTARSPADEIALAKAEAVPATRAAMPVLAPHAAEQAVAAAPERKLHRLTIDANIQKSLEDLARERARALGPDISVAIVVVDNAIGEVLARVASPDYFDERRAGQVDMSQALRSPGSTLKPFIYGLGFEDGLIHPETLVDDRPVRFGSYAPENFDLSFQGTVTIRRALQLSLNVPAVVTLEAVRASRLTARLSDAGLRLVLPKGEVPGLAMGLGGVGVTLSDLTMLYAGLARGGNTVALTERRDELTAAATPRRLLDPVAAWYVGNVLIGTPPPENAVGGRIAFKTGTSYGYRDAWSIGFDGKRTIGVWVGRPDGAPIPGLVGRSAAAPILFDAFARVGGLLTALPKAPKGVIVATTQRLPPPLQRFRPGALAGEGSEPPLRILFPLNGSRLERASVGERELPLKVSGGVQPLTMLVNGVPAPRQAGRTMFFAPDGPGFVRLTVMDARGIADSVVVRVD